LNDGNIYTTAYLANITAWQNCVSNDYPARNNVMVNRLEQHVLQC